MIVVNPFEKNPINIPPGPSHNAPRIELRHPKYELKQENKAMIYAEFELPGVSMDDVSIRYEDGALHLRAMRYKFSASRPNREIGMNGVGILESQGPNDKEAKQERIPTVLYTFIFSAGPGHDIKKTRASMREGLLTLATPGKQTFFLPIKNLKLG